MYFFLFFFSLHSPTVGIFHRVPGAAGILPEVRSLSSRFGLKPSFVLINETLQRRSIEEIPSVYQLVNAAIILRGKTRAHI